MMTNLRHRPASWARTLPMSAVLLAFLGVGAAPNREAEKLQFNRDIRPILAENCFACHGPDKNTRKAGLRLDMREEAIGLEAIVPGKPEKSGIVERIFSSDPKHMMPPPKSHKTLTMAQKEAFRRWI